MHDEPVAARRRRARSRRDDGEDCEFVGTFNGTSGWGGSGATAVGANNAKNAVFERAARAGATHVVFTELSGGMFTKATGRAYKCPPTPAPG